MNKPILISLAALALLSAAVPAQARDWDNGRHLGWSNGMHMGWGNDWRARRWTSNNYWNNGWNNRWNNNNLSYWQQQRLLRQQQLGSRWRNRWY